MKKSITAVVLFVLVFVLCACAKKTEKQEPFVSEPVDMYETEDCGPDLSFAASVLGSTETKVFVNSEEAVRVNSIQSPEETAGEGNGILLISYDQGMDQYASRYGYDFPVQDDAAVNDILSIIPVSFSSHTANYLDVCTAEVGIQIEIKLPEKTEFCFISPEGYFFTPADASEYTDESLDFLNFAVLPSGLAYEEFDAEKFARLAAYAAAYSGKAFTSNEYFEAFNVPDNEAAGYRLCISGCGYHLDLSLLQAREFLKNYIGCGENGVALSHFEIDPEERPDSNKLIKITEYSSYGETELTLYLAPDGRLIKLRNTLRNEDFITGVFFSVDSAMIISSDPVFDYGKTLELLQTNYHPLA